MAGVAGHRGPDGVSVWVGGEVGLGFLSLAVTAGADQPLVVDGVAVVADVRLDARAELVAALASAGSVVAAGASDVELVLAAYRCWGEGCAARLLGDFAFVVWDGPRCRLFAARDAMGMRPLYFRVEPGRVLFGSEVKQVLAAPGVPVAIHEPAVAAYLAGTVAPLDETFYAGVSSVAPAHALVVEADRWRTWRYWDIDPSRRVRYGDEREYAEHFRSVFAEAVSDRLRSDRPVGILLSGGMDSGSVASMAGWLRQRDPSVAGLRAYSWAFDELVECDERSISRLITDHYGMATTDIPADDAWPLADYPDHGPDQDEPFTWVYQGLLDRAVSTAAAQGTCIVLGGDRGDELVGDWIFDALGLLRSGSFAELARDLRADGMSLRRGIRRHLLGPVVSELWPPRTLPQVRHVLGARTLLTPPAWVRPSFARRTALGDLLAQDQHQPGFRDPARRARYRRIFAPAGMRVAAVMERTRSRAGTQYADPFSDRRLAELVLSMPQALVQRRGEPKRILRRAMRDVTPKAALLAARKVIPTTLYDRGFREREVATARDLLTNTRAAAMGWLDESAARHHFEGYVRGEQWPEEVWAPLTLEMWLRRWWS